MLLYCSSLTPVENMANLDNEKQIILVQQQQLHVHSLKSYKILQEKPSAALLSLSVLKMNEQPSVLEGI